MKTEKKYPSGEEVRQFLTNFFFDISPEISLDILAREAAHAWEIKSCWNPFLNGSKVSTRTFTLCDKGGYIDFKGGLIRVDKVENDKGELLEVDLDYRLLPKHSELGLDGYQWMELRHRRYIGKQVHITGIWGAVEKVPLLVWNAVLKKAAAEALACLSYTKEAHLESWSEGGVTERYKVHPFSEVIKRWEENFNHTVLLYRRSPFVV